MAEINRALIKKAVLANHGGFENASDSQIMTLWRSLPEDVQQRYLDGLKKSEKKGGTDAVSDKS